MILDKGNLPYEAQAVLQRLRRRHVDCGGDGGVGGGGGGGGSVKRRLLRPMAVQRPLLRQLEVIPPSPTAPDANFEQVGGGGKWGRRLH